MDTHRSNIRISAILLAGGLGSRMQSKTPKQFLQFEDKPIASYSFDVLSNMAEIDEIIVVCSPEYQHLFQCPSNKKLLFASPGERRQDSVFNGLMKTSRDSDFVCIHDGARPFIDQALVTRALQAGIQYGAATAGLPIRFTVKQSDSNHFVSSTPNREHIWEIQTPQVIKRDLLMKGFEYANQNNLTVTDDVSLIELLGEPVKLVEGSDINIKITVPSDLHFMQAQLDAMRKKQACKEHL